MQNLNDVLALVVPAARAAQIDSVEFELSGRKLRFDVRGNSLDLGSFNFQPARRRMESREVKTADLDIGVAEEEARTFVRELTGTIGLQKEGPPVSIASRRLCIYWYQIFRRRITEKKIKSIIQGHIDASRIKGICFEHRRNGNGYCIEPAQFKAN